MGKFPTYFSTVPITINFPQPGLFGPGAQVSAHTDIIDPIGIDWIWRIRLQTQSEQTQFENRVPTTGGRSLTLVWGDPTSNLIIPNVQQVLKDGDQARVLVELLDAGFNVKESASVGVTYDTTVGLPVLEQLQGQTQGGLTAEQAEQLAGTAEATALSALTDALTLTELTNGPTSSPLVVPLNTVTFGVIVRLTSIPVGLEPQTPDGQYWVKTLAVVRVFRGNDLWIRAPIHTPTKIVAFEREGLTVWVANLTLTEWLLNIRVLVDWLPGVTGQVFQMHFP